MSDRNTLESMSGPPVRGMEFVDDRSEGQRETHRWLVVGTDRFMSGWGKAAGGVSYAAWACESLEAANQVESWVRGRSDMKRVRVVHEGERRWKPRGNGHAHVYVVVPGHPSLGGGAA